MMGNRDESFKAISCNGISKVKTEGLNITLKKNKGFKRAYKKLGETEEEKTDIAGICEEEMGVSLVVAALIRSRKPIVGHNFIYDLGFLYHQFIDLLPPTYPLFKAKVHENFPTIYDTKVLARAHCSVYTQFSLEHVLKKSIELNKNKVKFVFPPEFRNLEDVKEGHNAGFDAFCTGKAFTIMAKLIEKRVIRATEISKYRERNVEPKVKVSEKDKEAAAGKEAGEKSKKESEAAEEDEKKKLLAMIKQFKHGPSLKADKK